MDFLKNNLSSFAYADKFLIEDKVAEIPENIKDRPLIAEPTYDSNRIFYLGLDLFDIDLINEITETMSEKSILILWYLKSDSLQAMLTSHDFSELDEKIIFMCGKVSDDDFIAVNSWLIKRYAYNLTNVQPIIKFREDLEYIRSCKEIVKFMNEFRTDYRFMLGNDINDTLIGVRNRMLNYPTYCDVPGINDFIKHYGEDMKNKPAIIVSSGPSLDKNIQELTAYQDNTVIFASDSSLITLANHDIVPDFVGSVERVHLTYELFYKNKVLPKRTTFIGPAVVRPEIFEDVGRPFVAVYKDRDRYGTWLNDTHEEEKGIVYCGTSVSHMLMNLAHKMGCDPVILIGQDLAYSKDGISHTSASAIKQDIDAKDATVYVESIDGEQLPSTVIWKNFLHLFETLIREEKINLIDATEGGAKITGSKILPLKTVLDTYAKVPKINIREAIESLKLDEDIKLASLNNGHKSIIDLLDRFNVLKERLDKAIDMNKDADKIMKKGLETQEELDEVYDSMEYIDDEVVKYIAGNAYLMMMYQYPIFKISGYINSVKEDQFTEDNIKFNVECHRVLLEMINKYNQKTIKTLCDGLVSYEKELQARNITFDTHDLSSFEEIINDKENEIHLD